MVIETGVARHALLRGEIAVHDPQLHGGDRRVTAAGSQMRGCLAPYRNVRAIKTCHLQHAYYILSKKSIVLEFQTSCLIIRFIPNFYINIIYFVKIYFIIKDILLIIYLFYNLHKIF
jgi:hypothetical protein